jgi:non-ribosomal peptide synthetase component E (peptide arylation enzyme)
VALTVLPQLPLTAVGKLDKLQLRALADAAELASISPPPPSRRLP